MWVSCCGPWPQNFVFICLEGANQKCTQSLQLVLYPNTRKQKKIQKKDP
jgi:hypothetical protein